MIDAAQLNPLRTFALRMSILSALLITISVRHAPAQEVVETVPSNDAAQNPSLQATESATPSPIVELNGGQAAETPRRFRYEFQLVVRGVYDDNIDLTQTNKTSDYYFSIEPRISLSLGGTGEDQTNFLNFVYAPNA